MEFERIAWTGGSRPKELWEITEREFDITMVYFREQMLEYALYWKTDVPEDVMQTFWNRARHDAHATIRYELDTKERVRALLS